MDASFEAAAYLKDKKQVLFFRNNTVRDLSGLKKLWSTGILFKIDKDYNKNYGDRSTAFAEFKLNYGTTGSWKDLNVKAYGNSALNTYLFNTKNIIFNVESEAIAGVTAKYQTDSNETSRIGAKLKIDVLNNTFYEKDTITEKKKTEKITDAASKKKAVEASKEETKNKGFTLPNKEWKEERLLFAKSYMAGPVPLTIAGGVDGNLTLKTGFELEGIGAYLTGKIEGNINGFIRGGLDYSVLSIIFTTDATFAHTELNGKVGAKIELNDSNDFIFGLDASMDTTIKLLKIFLKVSAKLGYDSFSIGRTVNIWNSPWAFNETFPLLDYKLPLLTIPTEDELK